MTKTIQSIETIVSMEELIGGVREEVQSAKENFVALNVKLIRLERAMKELKGHVIHEAAETKLAKMTPRQLVIQKAKDYVDNKFHDKSPFVGKVMKYKIYAVVPEFHVNREKQTVTCLLKGAKTGRIKTKSFAKAAPMDVFNVHIGKAIALAKALGEPIPNEFFDAPQPQQAEVGDIVKSNSTEHTYTLSERFPRMDGQYGLAFNVKEAGGWIGEKQISIVDDSKEEGVNA